MQLTMRDAVEIHGIPHFFVEDCIDIAPNIRYNIPEFDSGCVPCSSALPVIRRSV